VRWTQTAAHVEKRVKNATFWSGNLKERNNYGDLGLDMRIILK
jgi:hypothetical protein